MGSMLTHVFHFLKCEIPSLSTTNKNAFSFLNYRHSQFEQPTTSSAAETNHGATRIYFAFSILFLFVLSYIQHLLFTLLHAL